MANSNAKTLNIIMTGLLMAMITVVTAILPIPIPFGPGYVHLGDAVIFLSVLILGWKYGAVAAGFGSALADVILSYVIWAPWTLCVKGLMALIMGLFVSASMKKPGRRILGVPIYQLIGMVLGGAEMVVGYYIAEGFIYGNFVVPMLSVPWNVMQFVIGLVIASLVAAMLYKTPAKKLFTYPPIKNLPKS